jgi:DNA mismatch endonuclease (patch repair protein)
MMRAQLVSKAPTRPERVLYALLDDVVGPGKWGRQLLIFDRWTVDACLPHLSLVIQADGTYWHGFDPATHAHRHVAANVARDRAQAAYLAKAGWSLLRLWEHDLKRDPEGCRIRIAAAVTAAQEAGGTRESPSPAAGRLVDVH